MLTRESLLFSPTREGIPSSDDNFTADDLMSSTKALEDEARDTLPFEFTTCTYDLGPLKQPLYSCLTCSPSGSSAICAACSISCHAQHELVELFSRRDFTCDCGTLSMGAEANCSIGKRTSERKNINNKYDRCFLGQFCFCGVPYDPITETDEMYQCIVCEDWIHHACLFGSHSNSDSSPLSTDDFDMLVCERCVKNSSTGVKGVVERWVGVEGSGVMIIGNEGEVLGALPNEEGEEEEDGTIEELGEEVVIAELQSVVEGKRKAEDLGESEGGTKRLKLPVDKNPSPSSSHATVTSTSRNSSLDSLVSTNNTPASSSTSSLLPSPFISSTTQTISCSAPPRISLDQPSILSKIEKDGGKINIYFAEGWRERWCRCSECLPRLFRFPYFLEEEETYEPPEDLDAYKSTEELGMDALDRLPREQAVAGAQAFVGLSARLKIYLKPFADQNIVVTKDMIEEFFRLEKERKE